MINQKWQFNKEGSKVMFCCPHCQHSLELLESGGCGGRGSTYGCPLCDALFEQTTGGIIHTAGGEKLRLIHSGSYKKFKKEKS